MKIISGGQVGTDIAALRAAKQLGFDTGGWMPQGFKTLDGPKPEYAELYGVQETESDIYPIRTRSNVLLSDGTLRIAKDWESRGEICTLNAIQTYNKPYYDLEYETVVAWNEKRPTITRIFDWLVEHDIKVLNIAGNANKAYEEPIEKFLVALFDAYEDDIQYRLGG